MTNYEKYNGKGSDELVRAYQELKRYVPLHSRDIVIDFAEWLGKDVDPEKELPLPCPFCGQMTEAYDDNHGGTIVICSQCHYKTKIYGSRKVAIAAHNRVARAVAKAEGGEA